MATDSGSTRFSGSLSSFRFDDETLLPYPDKEKEPSNSDANGDDSEFSETVFKYISQMLMEEDMEEEQIFPDPWALQAAEKSLYEALDDQKHTDHPLFFESPDNHSWCSDFDVKSSSSGSISSIEPICLVDSGQNGVLPQNSLLQNSVFQSSVNSNVRSPIELLVGPQSMLVSQFQKGVEEANKFLPKVDNKWFTDLGKVQSDFLPLQEMKMEKDDLDYRSSTGYRQKKKKNHKREEDIELNQPRMTKQSANFYLEEADLSEMFDKILIFPDGRRKEGHCLGQTQTSEANDKPRTKKPVFASSNDMKEVDLTTLLILCAQAVSSDDRRTANEYLKQIRRHASPLGNGSHRLAHYFANGLEARLGGRINNCLDSKTRSAVDVLRIHQVYLSACPFRKLANIFANNKILIVAEKATTLHIIDFGISYGFQWPALIFRLSRRACGPPKLRITGIELPERGFRPAERVQQTGRHLAKCCERFNVPFEYTPVAQTWESVRIDDLKLRKGEMVVMNSMFRFENLLDETVVLNNPRDSVLRLVREVCPDLLTLSVVNGLYNAPFFVTRFREALFHYSALFDVLDSNLVSEDPLRLMFEKECYGRELMNIVSCEGVERLERPETYKQWQIRNLRSGLKPVSLDWMIMKKLRFKLRQGYSDDFVINEDGHWMLQGWKGRILYASSYWVPS